MSSAIMAAKQFAAAAPVCSGAKVTERSSIIASKQNASASVRPMFLPATMLNEPRFTSMPAISRHELAGRTSQQLPHVKAQIQDRKVTQSMPNGNQLWLALCTCQFPTCHVNFTFLALWACWLGKKVSKHGDPHSDLQGVNAKHGEVASS